MLPLLVVLACLLLTFFWYRNKKLPPGPWGLPILGYLPWIDPKAPYETFTNLSRKYGSVFGVYLGSLYTVVLTDTKDIRTVLAKDAAAGRAPLFVTHGIMKGYGKILILLSFVLIQLISWSRSMLLLIFFGQIICSLCSMPFCTSVYRWKRPLPV